MLIANDFLWGGYLFFIHLFNIITKTTTINIQIQTFFFTTCEKYFKIL